MTGKSLRQINYFFRWHIYASVSRAFSQIYLCEIWVLYQFTEESPPRRLRQTKSNRRYQICAISVMTLERTKIALLYDSPILCSAHRKRLVYIGFQRRRHAMKPPSNIATRRSTFETFNKKKETRTAARQSRRESRRHLARRQKLVHQIRNNKVLVGSPLSSIDQTSDTRENCWQFFPLLWLYIIIKGGNGRDGKRVAKLSSFPTTI